jgi:hypothetical protein
MVNQEWFSKEQLALITQPTMHRVTELVGNGELEEALNLTESIKSEWSFLRKLMVDSTIELMNYIELNFGDHRNEALNDLVTKVWQPAFLAIEDDIRMKVAGELTERWGTLGVDVWESSFIEQFSRKVLSDMTYPLKGQKLAEKLKEMDLSSAKSLCLEVDHEWGLLHDLLVESIASLLTFIGNRFGEDRVGDSLKFMTEKVWKVPFEKINSRDRKSVVLALAATWRAHSTGGIGPEAGGFTVEEDDEKFTFTLKPCGSGQRLVNRGYYEEPAKFAKTKEAHPWSFNREDFPYYCAHCTYMNEVMPIEWSGAPVYPLDPPKSFKEPCTWYYYKNPEDTPERFFKRYGYDKETMLNKSKSLK